MPNLVETDPLTVAEAVRWTGTATESAPVSRADGARQRAGWDTLRAWWHDPIDYRWLVHTLETRGALHTMKVIVALAGAALAVITGLNLISTAGPHGWVRQVTVFNTAMAVVWAVSWAVLPWPGERRSLVLVAGADVLITAGCLAESCRLFGALSLMQLVVTGGYLAMFHGPRVLALHAGWSLLSVLALTAMVLHARTGDTAEAASVVLTMAAVTVMLMPALHFCYWVLRMDALTDPLTGLLNRRGLDYYVSSWFGPGSRGPICLMTIDLDRFKCVNDTFGHAAGDRVLVRVAGCLRAAVPPGAVVARSGGEEFIVLARLSGPVAMAEAGRLCRAVAGDGVTASIGVAVSGTVAAGLEDLVRGSDTAMYRAKRAGGNRAAVAS
ncbi:GGDEF domain-containing protein [Nocardia stercoris]|uniref:GGDEF domain-containing protein n=1 Tax=Nocardia stercoris TaxID=2483361 RepID=A0A3M2L2Q2_9NOCA|nr:GGDEF domain-containing protein [Nocardia stercoris]RMI30115.1 GGDEF domain-containing protein [Nocardia stercoris]